MSAIFEAKAESVFLMAFEKLGLGKWISKTLLNLGMNEPTEIQNICIPEILSGKNVIGCSKTGSGKTAAFALPILQQLSVDPFGIYALVLAPTRELAFQIAEQFRIMGHPIGLKQSIIVGGMDMMTQSIELDKKPHLIIATPGRLADHLRNTANHGHFKRIKFLVLDEADYLLNDTLTEDLHTILDQMPKKRQTLLFSATITDEIKSIASNGTFIHKTVQDHETNSNLQEKYLLIPSAAREAYLAYLLTEYAAKDKQIVIFVNRSKTCAALRLVLFELGIRSTCLHALMSQQERLSSIAKFKGEVVPILIATDVGSRGLDIPLVDLVLNYEIPANSTDYIHRVGRTARAGRSGMSISFASERDIELILSIEKRTKKKMEELILPEDKVLDLLNKVVKAKRIASMKLSEMDADIAPHKKKPKFNPAE